jgi:hypothetical protein
VHFLFTEVVYVVSFSVLSNLPSLSVCSISSVSSFVLYVPEDDPLRIETCRDINVAITYITMC